MTDAQRDSLVPLPANHPGQAPSTRPGPMIVPQRPSRWPVVLGIIMIVLASLAMLGGVWNVAAAPLMRAMFSSMPHVQGQPDPAVGLENHMTSMIVLGLCSAAVASALLAGGIGLVRKRRWARTAIFAWVAMKVVLVIANTALAAAIQHDNFSSVQGSPAASSQQAMVNSIMQNFVPIIQAATIVFSLIWGWALPAFCLVWFMRRKIRAEMAAWADRKPAPAQAQA